MPQQMQGARGGVQGQSTSGNPAPFNLDQFLLKQQPQIQPIQNNIPYVDGGLVRMNLPNAGAGSEIMVSIVGSITVAGTVTGGTFQNWPYPAPFSMIQNMSLTSNQNFIMHNLSGWSWYKWVRQRYGVDPIATNPGSFSTDVNALLGIGAPAIIPGAAVTARTYPVAFSLPIPLAYNRELLTGLIALQNNSILYTLQLQFGNIVSGISSTGGTNALFNALVGTGLSITANLNITADIELSMINPTYPPAVSMLLTTSEQTFQLTPGVNRIQPAVNDLFTMFIMEFSNNGEPINQATMSSIEFQYSGNLRRYQEDPGPKLGFDFWHTNVQAIDGNLTWDMGIRKGLVKKRDLFDAFDDTIVTNLQLNTTIPTTITVTQPSQITLIQEALRFVTQQTYT